MNKNQTKQVVEARLATAGQFVEVPLSAEDTGCTWRYSSDTVDVRIYLHDNYEEMSAALEGMVMPHDGYKGSCGSWIFTVMPRSTQADKWAVLSIVSALAGEE